MFACIFQQHVLAVAQAGFFSCADIVVQGKAAALSSKALTLGLQFFIAPTIPFKAQGVGVLGRHDAGHVAGDEGLRVLQQQGVCLVVCAKVKGRCGRITLTQRAVGDSG